MTQYQMLRTYLEVVLGTVVDRAHHDERGASVAETVVIVGVSLLGAAAVTLILWQKLRGGAENVNVPAPAAP